jgi:hypothetical protein
LPLHSDVWRYGEVVATERPPRGDGVLKDSLLAGQTLIRLSEACAVNEEPAEVCDTYDVMDERHLLVAFGLSAAG